MKSWLIAVAAAGSLMVAGAATAQSGADLAGSKGCGTCPAADAKKVGPSWKDVAAKNKDNKHAPAKIATMLKDSPRKPAGAGACIYFPPPPLPPPHPPRCG